MNRNIYMTVGAVFLLLVLIKIFNISYPITLRVVNTNESAEFTVTGTGKVSVVPDVAVIDAGITVSNIPTADQAKQDMTAVNNRIIQSLKALGIDAKDIETSSFNIYPEYSRGVTVAPLLQPQTTKVAVDSVTSSAPSTGTSKISGYNGTASVTVKARKKDQASQVIQKVTEAGANNVSGPRFAVDDPEVYREQARSEAIKNAKENAKKLAKELGISLGKVTNMMESGGMPYYDARAGISEMSLKTTSAEPAIFEPGSDEISSTVTLFFERK